MKKSFIPLLAFIVLLSLVSVVHAQSPAPSTSTPSTQTVQSDFAKDLQDGQQATANDQQAQQNQNDEKNNENIGVEEQGQVQNGQQEVNQQDLGESQDNLNQQQGNGD